MGELKTVYRFEHPLKESGPYISGFHLTREQRAVQRELLYAHDCCKDRDHPGIYDDLLDRKIANQLNPGTTCYLCACDSIDMLRYWFDGFFERLLEVGYRLKAYTMYVEDVYLCKSQLQVCFNSQKTILKADLTSTVSPL